MREIIIISVLVCVGEIVRREEVEFMGLFLYGSGKGDGLGGLCFYNVGRYVDVVLYVVRWGRGGGYSRL